MLHGANRAAVFSTPPSEVGVGIMASDVVGSSRLAFSDGAFDFGRSINAMYIWVVKRFGIFVGVIQRVNGIKDSFHRISIGHVE